MAETDPTWKNWGRMKPDDGLFYQDYKKRSESLCELLSRSEAEVERLRSRVAGLESIISEPVKSFGTPELVTWAEKLQRILADFPEEERGELPFVFTMGDHLEKFAKSWNSPTIASLRDENSGLRAALEPFAKAADYVDSEADGNDHLSWFSDHAGLIVADALKARAALGGESSDLVAVPSDTLDWIFRSLCAYLDYFGVDSRCYDPKEAAEAIRPYTSLGNPSETPISSGRPR